MAASGAGSVASAYHVGKRLDIQVLRAAAVLLVVLYHLPGGWHLGGGFVGVDVFFAISGFVITESILRSSAPDLARPRFFLDFMRRRCRRLVPALALAVAVAGVLILFVGPADQARAGIHSAIASLLFVSNYWFLRNFDSYWTPELAYNPLLHMWSLAVEFQVYLVFPVLFIVGVRTLRGRTRPALLRRLALIVAVCSLASLALFVYLLELRTAPVLGRDPQTVAFYTPFPRFWEFGAGALVALLLPSGTPIRRGLGVPLRLGAIAVGAVSVYALASASAVGLWVIPAIAATAVVLAVPTRVVDRWRGVGVIGAALVWLGDRSYSVYLWHWPWLALLIWTGHTGPKGIAAALLATLVAGDLSFRLVERGGWPPWRGVSVVSRLSRPLSAFGLAAVVLVAAAVAVHGNVLIHTRPADSVATPFPPSQVDATAATLPMYDCGQLGPETHCVNAGPDAPELVVIGDSLGYRLLPAVQYVARKHGLNTSMFWASGCGIEFQRCPEAVRAYLTSHRIAGIVIAQNFARESVVANGAERDAGLSPACDPAQPIADCAAHRRAAEELAAGAVRGLRELTAITPNILVALPFPQQALTFPNCLTSGVGSGPAEATDDYACGWTGVAWQRTRQGLLPDAIRDAVTAFPGVQIWDPIEVYCVDGRCPAVIDGGEVIMNDAVHMTMEASRYSIPVIERFVQSSGAAPAS